MDGDGEGMRLSKRFSEKGEVDYKTKAGTAWSHNFLNQKPWHPLSYPNQRRKWIAEQTDAQQQRRAQEIAREFAQEQEFFRQTALVSKKEKEKIETMKAVSFMYVRPPGYNAESAKAAEVDDERKRLGLSDSNAAPQDPIHSSIPPIQEHTNEEKRKSKPKDVFGRTLPTEEEFEVLKNAPRLETGMPARVKPFAVEVRNVKCARCGKYGHQSGDRECPLKDAIMPNEESRLKRDDPLTAILAQTNPSEPLKWELKQKPGMSPPRGGFKPDDPNQQIVAEDIFDEYGGFLSSGSIPDILTNLSVSKCEKHSRRKRVHKHHSKGRHKRFLSPISDDSREEGTSTKRRKKCSHRPTEYCDSPNSSHFANERNTSKKNKKKKRHHSVEQESSDSDYERQSRMLKKHKRKKHRSHSVHYNKLDPDEYNGSKQFQQREVSTSSSYDSDNERENRRSKKHNKKDQGNSYSSKYEDLKHHNKRKYSH